MQEPLFKTRFSATAHVLKQPSEDILKESKASLSDLKKLLPEDIRPEEDPDLLYIVANLAVPGMVNLNDDCLMPDKAVAVYKKFEKKLSDIEHNRSDINGFILKSCLTNEDNEEISEEEALSSKKPFFITTISVLWKIANRKLCELIEEASDPSNPNYNKFSLSFEVGFSTYDIGVTTPDRNAFSARIYNLESQDWPVLEKTLRANGGNGIADKEGDIVFRVLKDGIIPLGQGVVLEPAAQVRGIEVIKSSEEVNEPENDKKEKPEEDDKEEKEPEEREIELTPEQLVQIIKDTVQFILSESKKNNKLIKNSVLNSISNNHMKNLQELEASWDEVKTQDSKEVFANVRQILTDEITKASEEFAKKQEEEKARSETLAKEKEAAELAQAELKKQLEAIQSELQTIKDAAVAAQKEQSFNNHMSLIDQTFDLDEDEMALITAEVRDLDDESFAKWMDKSKKLMKEKTKAFKAEKKEKMEKKLCDAGVKVTLDDKTLDFVEILASAKQVEPTISNVVETSKKESIFDQVKKAFGQDKE